MVEPQDGATPGRYSSRLFCASPCYLQSVRAMMSLSPSESSSIVALPFGGRNFGRRRAGQNGELSMLAGMSPAQNDV